MILNVSSPRRLVAEYCLVVGVVTPHLGCGDCGAEGVDDGENEASLVCVCGDRLHFAVFDPRDHVSLVDL